MYTSVKFVIFVFMGIYYTFTLFLITMAPTSNSYVLVDMWYNYGYWIVYNEGGAELWIFEDKILPAGGTITGIRQYSADIQRVIEGHKVHKHCFINVVRESYGQ